MARQVCVLDRIEDNALAVLEREDGIIFDLPSGWLPKRVQEGDVISLEFFVDDRSSSVSLSIDEQLTSERREQVRALRASLPQASEGDIEL